MMKKKQRKNKGIEKLEDYKNINRNGKR